MHMGRHFFRKGQSIWTKPIIEYDQSKMDQLVTEIVTAENETDQILLRDMGTKDISMETALYLILHS